MRVRKSFTRALALQIGNEVSYNELAQLVGVDKNTINNYITILEQGYVVFRLTSFSRNLRNEIKTNQKIYFYDTGVRNAVIGNFNTLDSRTDKGGLWENFLISERIKKINYEATLASSYFWRTKQQQEIDYVEEVSGQITGYEFKWNPKTKVKFPRSFMEAYNSKIEGINKDNFRVFIM